ncbi:YhgE/Pip N-terminal domain protein [Xylanimonas cellulosilytica DSM 15894]|uniref:YhgE/Pip N-terminal domain protein n=1 Tax=Xylanimonas cellulosilytica (strain DSM 15894 / JCM 12276 / CECT 5975 / KCTC 9989 / LMG 20990 / NBRC 107835 / XIL07) TaxID=446471 RepID=D1C0L4_XYLCX|nr:YhgE/Pip domain-containing protein [Xylanimonas cellulosilytica]ACZ32217.1 YhgE/Pip N-terminal domain protein [Xylanimonas cellulosilytica DSM 15894]
MNALIRTGARAGIWRLVAVALLPVLVLGLLLAALWNPVERLDTVRAAIVNLDEPVTVDGQYVPLGRQLAAGLVSGAAPSTEQTLRAAPATDAGYDWLITNAERARAGLADGTYAAVVTIPADFSAAATSFGGDAADARQATIDVATPAGGRVADAVIARYVASTATAVMGSSLTETYVDNVLVGFTTLADQLGQAADGAGQLADGATSASDGAAQLADGAGQLADGATTASDGAAQLADGARQAASGAGDLATGAGALADGAAQLADGAGQVAAGIGQSKGGADALAAGAQELRTSLGTAAAGARASADGIAGAATGVTAYADVVQQAADGLTPQIAALQAIGCTPDSTVGPCAPLAGLLELRGALLLAVNGPNGNDGLAAIGAGLSAATSTDPADTQTLYALADGLQAAADQGAGGLADGAEALSDGLGRLATGADQVTSGASGLASGARDLSSGARALSGGIGQVASGTGELAGGIGEIASGSRGLASGAGDLADGVGQVAGGAEEISDGLGQAVDQLPAYSDGDRATLASVVANPVQAPGDDTLETGSTGPLFAVVALWLGALGLTTVVRPSPARLLGATLGAPRLALADLAVPTAVGAATGAAVGGILAAVEHLSVGGWFGAIGLGALVSVVFVALHQGFTMLLGDLARGASLLMAVLVIATGVVATVPQWLAGIADFLAVGAARRALVGLVIPAAGGTGAAVTSLVVWGLAGVALAVLMTARARTVRVSRLLAAA